MLQTAGEHIQHSGLNGPLFQSLSHRFQADWPELITSPPSNVDVQLDLWNISVTIRCLRTKGSRATLTRWFGSIGGYAEFDNNYIAHMFLCWLCWQRGSLRSLPEMSIWDVPQDPPSAGTSSARPSVGKTVAMSNAEEEY